MNTELKTQLEQYIAFDKMVREKVSQWLMSPLTTDDNIEVDLEGGFIRVTTTKFWDNFTYPDDSEWEVNVLTVPIKCLEM